MAHKCNLVTFTLIAKIEDFFPLCIPTIINVPKKIWNAPNWLRQ